MNGRGKSDGSVVPKNLANKGGGAPQPAERGEGRGPANGNLIRDARYRTQSRIYLKAATDRIRQAAAKDKKMRFTTLWHHVYNCLPRRLGCKGKARVAGARKIAESIWRLLHWGECFDAAKPFGGVPTEVR